MKPSSGWSPVSVLPSIVGVMGLLATAMCVGLGAFSVHGRVSLFPLDDRTLIVLSVGTLISALAVWITFIAARQIHDEVHFVRMRISDAVRSDAPSRTHTIPVRSLDEVGALASAFNLMVARFAAAERSYQADLDGAATLHRERSDFLAGLSHELRTPLNAILGFAHVLEVGVDGPLSHDAKESLAVIRTSGEHLRTLIADILDLSAMESGQLRLVQRPVEMRKVVEAVVREARPALAKKPVSIVIEGEPEATAFGDKKRIRQILTNLVSNAVKFTEAGAITITLVSEGDQIRVRVNDSGPGIPETELDKLFTEYGQLGDLGSRRGGTGLGLAISKRLAVMHGGNITVQSTVGVGSTFEVTVPLAKGDEIEDPPSISGLITEDSLSGAFPLPQDWNRDP